MTSRWPGLIDLGATFVVAGAMIGTANMPPDGIWHGTGGEPLPGSLDAVSGRPIDGWALALHGLCVVAVLVARRWPAPAVATVAAALLTYSAVDYPAGPIFVAAPAVLLLTGLVWGWRRSWIAAAVLVCSVMGGHLVPGPPYDWSRLAISLGWAGTAVLASEVVRNRAERAAERSRRVAEEAERARLDERLAIAQDLHDGVAHALSVIAIQSRVAARDPAGPQGQAALAAITSTSTAAMADLTAMVKGLRVSSPAPRHPVGSLDQVAGLAEQAREAGQQVDVTVVGGDPTGSAPALPAVVSAAAYRVVQEGLTNALRHAPGAPVDVRIDTGDGLAVTVHNGAGPADEPAARAVPSARVGLVGMRERVEAAGGALTAGRSRDGGWEVRATWPPRSGS